MPAEVISRRGDTLIEVLFSILVFSLVAIITVNLMNNGISTAQRSLEITMARTEIDAQAEALRFVHHSFLNEHKFASGVKQYDALWQKIVDNARSPDTSGKFANSFNDIDTCEQIYEPTADYGVVKGKAFVLNTRLIHPESTLYLGDKATETINYNDLLKEMVVFPDAKVADSKFQPTPLYPRIIYRPLSKTTDKNSSDDLKEQSTYRQIALAEGIWVFAVKSSDQLGGQPQFYDFYIRTCWHSIGRQVPSTIGTIIRLYNPAITEGGS